LSLISSITLKTGFQPYPYKPIKNHRGATRLKRPRQLKALRILELASKGLSYVDIADAMSDQGMTVDKVRTVMDGLNRSAQRDLQTLIPDSLALEYSKSLLLLEFLLKRTLDIEAQARTPYVSLQAIGQAAHLLKEKNALIAQCQTMSRRISKLVRLNSLP
jgi:hypothetical protein